MMYDKAEACPEYDDNNDKILFFIETDIYINRSLMLALGHYARVNVRETH